MLAHLRGRPHLMQKQRLHESRVRQATGLALGLTEALVPDKEKLQYDDKFWDRQRGGVRLRPEQEKFLDTTRYDRMEAKFKKDRYDGGQFRFSEEELHCKVRQSAYFNLGLRRVEEDQRKFIESIVEQHRSKLIV